MISMNGIYGLVVKNFARKHMEIKANLKYTLAMLNQIAV